MIKLAVGGSRGRMGQRVMALAEQDPRFEVAALFDIGVAEGGDTFDVLVDFSVPAGTVQFVERCTAKQAALVTGTTGHSPEQLQHIEAASSRIPILRASNFSVGVNVLLKLLPDIAGALSANFDIEIVETHHTRKVDAPSGTALALLEAILAATGGRKDQDVVYGRHGQVGAKDRRRIGVHAVRSGDVVGRHEIVFGGTGESITITHEALSRDTFAKGALEAAAWLCGRPAGLYAMRDALS